MLPAEGRQGPAPKPPTFVTLGRKGKAWWRWAWSTPQAAAWPAGSEAAVARRAQLEDLFAESKATGLLAEMRQFDDRLGLSPKAMASLRWSIGEPVGADDVDAGDDDNVVVPDRWRRSATG